MLLTDPFELPPKRLLATSFIPSAWIDDTLIAERKAGLTKYLSDLLKSTEYKDAPLLRDFFTEDYGRERARFDVEDAVPSTLSRKAAMKLESTNDVEETATPIAGAYYVDWAASGNPPEGVNFAKFDILFFGMASQAQNSGLILMIIFPAFATPSSSSTLSFGSGSQSILKRLATAAHNSGQGTKVVLSLLLGLPLYGYVSQSSKTVLTGSLQPSSDMLLLEQTALPVTDKERANKEAVHSEVEFLNGTHARRTQSQATVTAANLTSWWGQQIPFYAIVKSGALVKKSDGTYGQGGGFTMGWDDCSDTPYLFNQSQTTVVTYDDTWSVSSKADFAKKNGMAGCFTWSLDQDDGLTLQNAIRKSLGKP
ncbi:hypothetical protein H0H87_007402 [Tephrocybe sp. NHM501043]|nr:hypothetical protein H0H87_007402 [Tephrocybe sp. NHM501043]